MLRLAAVIEVLERQDLTTRQIRQILGLSGTRWKNRHAELVTWQWADRVVVGLGLHPVEVFGFEAWCQPALAEVIEFPADGKKRAEGVA